MSLAKLETFIFDKVSETKLPGLSAALIMGDQVVWSKGFGFRDLEQGLPATPHTLYSIGSLTKSFTAIAILQLAEQSQLKLDDTVDKYVPFDIMYGEEPVCIKHFLSHTSGIPALAYAENLIRGKTGASANWLPIASYSDLLTFMKDAQDWTLAEPGERWFYLNEGYVLLGYIIEKCSGMTYQEYVKKHILDPLDMKRSFFHKEEVDNDQDVATPYVITQAGERTPSTYPYGSLSGDGGLISNVLDLAKYVSMFLNWGELKTGQILTHKSIEAMESPHSTTSHKDGSFGDYSYGYGLGILPDFLEHTLIGHSGSIGVATAYMGFIPEKRAGILLLTNGSGYPLAQLGMYGLATALGQDPDELPFVQREKVLRELEGIYETYKGTMKAQVKRMGDLMVIEIKDNYNTTTVPLIPESIGEDESIFYTLAGGARITVEFRFHDGQPDMIYERYYFRKSGELPRS